ncbi:hypothetical protein COU61_04925 [Candidatus Pacearchaeota archaeon CG10_big_fil_rev_8_21_14_0_10_35_13]|nr:MAG: hypothetical protein COU61_04925 [Candidatus Pacearchaeota archaeon CG10_big_fil_rev_8_21_14_0_10_35_13]
MLPRYHIIYGFFFSLLLLLLFPQLSPLDGLIILLSTILIDFDHYLVGVFRNKNLSLSKAFKMFDYMREHYGLNHRRDIKTPIMFLHLGEVQLLLLFLSFFYTPLFLVLIGFLFHLLLDFIEAVRLGVIPQRDYFLIQRVIRKLFFVDNYKYI